MSDPFLTMHRLFRRLQQKNRFVGRVEHSGLTIAETHFIIELQADPSRGLSELAELLALNHSSCSRIAKNLEAAGLIECRAADHDSRRKTLLLSDNGRRLIEKIDTFSNGLVSGYASHLSGAEFAKLILLLRLIGDGYQHPPGIRRPREPEYRVEQRRVTRCFGLLGDQVFASSLSSSQWQALSEIVLSPFPPRVTELSDLLGIAQNSLSTVIDFFERNRYAVRRSHPEDKRITILAPLPEGVKTARAIEQRAVADLKRSMEKSSKRWIEEMTRLLSRFVGESDPVLPPLLPGYEVVELRSTEERARGRALAARALVEQNLEAFLPESTLTKKTRNYLLQNGTTPECVFALAPKGKSTRIEFAAWTPAISPWKFAAAINRADFMQGKIVRENLQARIAFEPLKRFLA